MFDLCAKDKELNKINNDWKKINKSPRLVILISLFSNIILTRINQWTIITLW